MRTVGREVTCELCQQTPSHASIGTFRLSLSDDAAPLGYDLFAFPTSCSALSRS